jgi:hypothetical protein
MNISSNNGVKVVKVFPKYVINVSDLDDLGRIDIQNKAIELGYRWYGGVVSSYFNPYFDEELLILHSNGIMGQGQTSLKYLENYNSYTKMSAEDFMLLPKKKQFTKSDLKDGMVIVCRDENEGRFLVYGEVLVQVGKEWGGWFSNLAKHCEDLSHESTDCLDIVEVLYMNESIWKRDDKPDNSKVISELKAQQEALLLQMKEIDDKINTLK